VATAPVIHASRPSRLAARPAAVVIVTMIGFGIVGWTGVTSDLARDVALVRSVAWASLAERL
jgi:hypothetical protein